jgi:hypothetical protein
VRALNFPEEKQQMKTHRSLVALAAVLVAVPAAAQTAAPTANGIELPPGYRDWRVISVSHRTDNNTLRAIVGNDIALAAARSGRTNPWPEGAIIGKLVWADSKHEAWPAATVPGAVRHDEFMIKDARRFARTGGWGYARWVGAERKPYGKDAAGAEQECAGCHAAAKATDFVFTRPAAMP